MTPCSQMCILLPTHSLPAKTPPTPSNQRSLHIPAAVSLLPAEKAHNFPYFPYFCCKRLINGRSSLGPIWGVLNLQNATARTKGTNRCAWVLRRTLPFSVLPFA